MTGQVFVIGAGLAGLSAAMLLAEAQRPVTVLEAGPVAGGRCRSYLDRVLGCRIDNGNHLLLSGNRAAHAYLAALGTGHTLGGPGEPYFPFVDLATGERWTLRLDRGRLPWWLLRRATRVPGTRLRDYLMLHELMRPRSGETLATLAAATPLARRLFAPLAVAALNTPVAEASAELFATILKETLGTGGAACIPSYPRIGLSESFVDPAVVRLRGRGAKVTFGRRVAGLSFAGDRVVELSTPDGAMPVGVHDSIVLAVPAPVAAELLPRLPTPDAFEAIINVHFLAEAERGVAGFWGVIGGMAEWIFVKPGVISITISAANRLVERSAEALARTIWPEVQAVCGLSAPMPAWRVVKERRATVAATPVQERRRPPSRTPIANLVLAGDWTATGLPGTIEGAIRSGRIAAEVLLAA